MHKGGGANEKGWTSDMAQCHGTLIVARLDYDMQIWNVGYHNKILTDVSNLPMGRSLIGNQGILFHYVGIIALLALILKRYILSF